MDARFYNSEEIDIERLANDLQNVYQAQNYQVQQIGNKDQMLVQLKKGGDFEAIIGMQAALSVTLQRVSGGTLAMIGHQKWIDKAAVGAVGMLVLWPLAVTAGVGAIRQASLANQVLNIVDGLVRQQKPGVQMGPIPVQLMPQVQQQWSPPTYSSPVPQYVPSYAPPMPSSVASQGAPVSTGLRCPNCNTPYEAGDTYCTGCGRPLAAQKTLCPNCKAEIKPGVAFCPNCGASTFSTLTATQAAPAPAPKPPTPTYTPPPAPKPPTPVYTPSQSAPPKPPAPQPYVPPTPQEPPVVPQPSVTLLPGTAKPQPPTPSKQPPAPTYTPVYTPSQQSQQAASKPQTPASSPAPQPIAAKPSSQPAFDPKATWGSLSISDGNTVQLSGERVLIGRYDHDLGGLKPEVDLSGVPGSDTVSRIHATIEHIGSSYTVTDLNSTNFTRLNGKRLEPDKATPLNDGDTLQFGKVSGTFKKA